MLATYAWSLVIFVSWSGSFCTSIDVSTEYGPVRGQTIPVVLDSGDFNVHSFWGIPYARPPVGDLRFKVSYEVYFKYHYFLTFVNLIN